MRAAARRRALAVLAGIVVFTAGVLAVAAILFLPVMYLAGAHTGVLSGALAGAVWVAGIGASVLIPAWLAIRTYRRVLRPAAAER
jgi:hypothetical protein